MKTRPGRVVQGGALLVLASLCAAACGGAGTPSISPAPAGASDLPTAVGMSPTPTASSGASDVATGHVGDTLTFTNFGGNEVDVTLVRVVDPATSSNPNNTPPAGSHWVGLEVTVNNHSPYAYDDLEMFDGTGSDGTKIDPNATAYSIAGFTGCSATAGDLQTGQPYTLCTGFLVPDGVTVTQIGARVGGAEIGGLADQATWTNP
jgi:hypothetical protein